MNHIEAEVESGDPISDQEIAGFAQQVLDDLETNRGPLSGRLPVGSGRRLSGLWMMAVFLLGMTCMEGLRSLAPGEPGLRGGEGAYRCGTPSVVTPARLANPGQQETVAVP